MARTCPRTCGDVPRLKDEVRRGFGPMATEMSVSLFSSGSVAFVGWRATTETVAVYSSAFRLYRLSVYFVTAMANGLTGWVAEKQGRVRGRRMMMALLAHTVVGVVGMVAMAALLPMVSTLLFGARLSVDHLASFYLGRGLPAPVGRELTWPPRAHPRGSDPGSGLLDDGRCGHRHPAHRGHVRGVGSRRRDRRPGHQPDRAVRPGGATLVQGRERTAPDGSQP